MADSELSRANKRLAELQERCSHLETELTRRDDTIAHLRAELGMERGYAMDVIEESALLLAKLPKSSPKPRTAGNGVRAQIKSGRDSPAPVSARVLPFPPMGQDLTAWRARVFVWRIRSSA